MNQPPSPALQDHNGTEPDLFWMPGIAGPLPVWAQVLQGCVPPSSPQEEKLLKPLLKSLSISKEQELVIKVCLCLGTFLNWRLGPYHSKNSH